MNEYTTGLDAAEELATLRQQLAEAQRRLSAVTLPEGIGNLLVRTILQELASDRRYPCCCGDEPYTDGEPCPKCAAIRYLEEKEATRATPNP